MTEEIVCGIDEAGRGPWAGPVVAAAVVLSAARPIAGLADSKQLSPRRRQQLCGEILRRALVGIGEASVEEIDRLNILQASLLAMVRAVARLPRAPTLALVDGNRAPPLACAVRTIVSGDAKEPAISAASIVAKVSRDGLLRQLAGRYPGYGFERHLGYGTPEHAAALGRLGPCALHRTSFGPVRRSREQSVNS
ncbi:MAG: ribonuclease HII [Alphaproteobacteria bacterium]|nr:ribonuclease HII [Alphaproteobacteria bacterium]